MKTTVAIVAMGEMGSALGQSLVERGACVLTSLKGRSRASAERAARARVEVVEDDCELVGRAEFVLSIVPPSRAGEFSARLLPHIRVTERKPVFVDCNAVAPATVKQIAAPFQADGLPFVDAGILGPPRNPGGGGPTLYASGDAAARFAELRQFGLDARVLSSELGDASALKMAYGAITKGLQALGTASILASMRAGISPALLQEMRKRQPAVLELLVHLVPQSYAKAYRWIGEMEEIAKFLEPEIGGSEMLNGAARIFTDLADDYAKGPDNGRIALLNEFMKQSEPQS